MKAEDVIKKEAEDYGLSHLLSEEYDSSLIIDELSGRIAQALREAGMLDETTKVEGEHYVSCLELYANNGKHTHCQCPCRHEDAIQQPNKEEK